MVKPWNQYYAEAGNRYINNDNFDCSFCCIEVFENHLGITKEEWKFMSILTQC